jgi:hypothetical protein
MVPGLDVPRSLLIHRPISIQNPPPVVTEGGSAVYGSRAGSGAPLPVDALRIAAPSGVTVSLQLR